MRRSELLRQISDGLHQGNPLVHLAVPAWSGGALSIPSPEGDPEALREVASTFRGGAGQLGQASADLDRLRLQRLPEVWDSRWGAPAAERRLAATGQHAEYSSGVLRNIANCVNRLATRVGIAQSREATAREQLEEAYARWELADPEDQDGRVAWMAILVGQMASAHELAENAGIEAAQDLNAYAGQAVAGQLDIPWLNAADLITLVNASDRQGMILTPADALLASAALAEMSPEDAHAFAALLAAAETDHEKAWLLKALAAGNSIDQLTWFANTTRGKDKEWLEEQLRPLRVPENQSPPLHPTWNGADLRQTTDTTCASMSMLMAQAIYDPVFALEMVWDPSLNAGQGGVVSKDVMEQRLAEHEDRIKAETSQWRFGSPPKWPGFWGTHPNHAADHLNNHSPVEYDANWSGAGVADSVAGAVAAASAGQPSMLLIGDGIPRHYVLVVGQDSNGNILIYDSRSPNSPAMIHAVAPADLYHEPLQGMGRLDRLWATVTPAG